MISQRKNKSYGGLQCPPNHCIVILGSMKGHSEMGQSQKSEGTAIANQLHKCHIMLVKCRNYITPESVAILSHSQNQRLSSVAFIFTESVAQMSLLYKCHVKWQSCFTESVAQMSLCQKCHTCCKYVLSSTLSRDASCKNVTPHFQNITPNQPFGPPSDGK